MNSLEQKDVKNPGAICDWQSHKHSSCMKMRCILVLPFVCFLVGCSSLTPQERIWVQWERLGHSDYSNFYEEYSKYPDYAIAVYGIKENYDASNDVKHLRASIALCRHHFGKAYRAGKLQRTNPEDSYDTNTFEFKTGYQPDLPFQPRYVVIAISDAADYRGPSSFDSCYKVAYIIPADLVLSRRYDFQRALQAAYIDRNPFHVDRPSPEQEKTGWSPAERYKWLAIERHEAYLRSKTGSAEDGAANGSQPIRSETNRTSSAAGSRR